MVDTYKHKGLRRLLVEELNHLGVKDNIVLEAVNTIPRHLFLQSAFWEHAYQNKAFPIGEGQTISHPYTVAKQTELLQLKKGDKVLEIGTGSGYQCAVLVATGAKVYSIERHRPLYKKAKTILNKLKLYPTLFCGDGTQGLPGFAPFDKIIVTAGAPVIPDSLIEQLKIGGTLIIPVGDDTNQSMLEITRVGQDKISKKNHGTFSFVPLIGKEGWKNN